MAAGSQASKTNMQEMARSDSRLEEVNGSSLNDEDIRASYEKHGITFNADSIEGEKEVEKVEGTKSTKRPISAVVNDEEQSMKRPNAAGLNDGNQSTKLPVSAAVDGDDQSTRYALVFKTKDGKSMPLWSHWQPSESKDVTSPPPPPLGVSLVKVPPPLQSTTIESKEVPTLRECFPPPPTLPALVPPRLLKLTSTRSNVVGWYNPADPVQHYRMRRHSSSNGYVPKTPTTGSWLRYGPAASGSGVSSPEARRRQHERTLSSGESRAREAMEDPAAVSAAKEDMLWQRALSSFAPSYDDSNAVIPQSGKNDVWWDRVGRDRMEQFFDPSTSQAAEDALAETWNPIEVPAEYQPATPKQDQAHGEEFFARQAGQVKESIATDEVDSVLEEVSGLIETLHSYQIRRLLTRNPTPRSTMPQEHSMTTVVGSPTTPNSAETEVYKALQSQLALMVSTLPPYAVSRLNGDKLRDLNISTKIITSSKNFQGMLEPEEELARAEEVADSRAGSQAVNLTAMDMSSQANIRTPTPYSVMPFPYSASAAAAYAPQTSRGTRRGGQYFTQQQQQQQIMQQRTPVPTQQQQMTMQRASVPATHSGLVNGLHGADAAIKYQQRPRSHRPSGQRQSSGAGASSEPRRRPSRNQLAAVTTRGGGPQQYFQQTPTQQRSSGQYSDAALIQSASSSSMTTPRQQPSQPRYQLAAQQRHRANNPTSDFWMQAAAAIPGGGKRGDTTPRQMSGWSQQGHPSQGNSQGYGFPMPQQQQQLQQQLQQQQQQQYQWVGQGPGQGSTNASSPTGASNVGVGGWSTVMSPEQQAQLMEKQRLELAHLTKEKQAAGGRSISPAGPASGVTGVGGNHANVNVNSNSNTAAMGTTGSSMGSVGEGGGGQPQLTPYTSQQQQTPSQNQHSSQEQRVRQAMQRFHRANGVGNGPDEGVRKTEQ